MTSDVKKPRRAIDGVLLLYKPKGCSSTQALGRAKWLLGALKGGHTGTLDPLADGLLPLCFGHATKLAHDLLDADKTYEANIFLGQQTSTGDAEGEVVFSSEQPISREQWDAVLPQFLGDILQVPPMYSALKKDGKPLYEYARAGVAVERVARPVRILHMETLEFAYPKVRLSVTCSKGTYIRTLAEDIGQALGVGAHLRGLTRTAVGSLLLDDALTLEAFEALDESARQAALLPLDALMQNTPSLHLSDADAARFVQGQRLKVSAPDASSVRVYWQNVLIGLAAVARHTLSPTKVLMTALPLI
ncbi:MAG: tRNA pseudouridine(55) synthase TruB [Formosimonas sp.]